MPSELERNIPNNPNWEGSFYETLTEYGEWNAEAFWKLHLELTFIAKGVNAESPVNRELSYMLLYLQQRVLNLISAHFNGNDCFKIKNLTNEQLFEFKERFEMAILGVITGEVLSESSFDLINPLLKNA